MLIMYTDITELSLPSTMNIEFPNEDDILNFNLSIEPDEGCHNSRTKLRLGMYKGGRFNFSFAISSEYPHQPPKVLCKQKVFPSHSSH